MTESQTPRAAGYRMPAEWEPHQATWLSWPHNLETWPGAMSGIPDLWAQLVAALAPGEEVRILVNDQAPRERVRDALARRDVAMERVFLHEVATNDAWMRDSGPTFVTRGDGGLALVDWRYNAWGGKYPPWADDDRIPERLATILEAPKFEPGVVLEGGSIDVNGAGTLMTTESCLLNPNRNPGLDRERLERVMRDYLNVAHFIWLGDGIVGDDTDGHIDDLARFVSENTVVTVLEEDSSDANYEPLRENLRRLGAAVDQDGKPLDIVTLPMPEPVYFDNQRLPASYANFYIGNEVVVVPTFRSDRDGVAMDTLAAAFPTRRIVGIDAVELVWGLGAFHCITQQQPR